MPSTSLFCVQVKKNAWLEIVLDEGKNRQIRRLLEAFHIEVLRLVRVAIGPIPLGTLAKGAWRLLTGEEVSLLEQSAQKKATHHRSTTPRATPPAKAQRRP